MASQSSTVLKTYFETGDIPTQSDFANFIDSYSNNVDNNQPDGWEYNVYALYPSSQSLAYQIVKSFTAFGNNIDNICGAIMPAIVANAKYVVTNNSINVIDLYPAVSEHWYGLADNEPYKLQPHTTLFIFGNYLGGWSIANTYTRGGLLLPTKASMVTVICGNSLTGRDQYTGSNYTYSASAHIANMLAGSPLRFKRCVPTTRTDRNGVYGYSGASLTTILPDLAAQWFAPLAAANIVPDLVWGKALLENDIGGSAHTYDQCISDLTKWIKLVRATWPNCKILLNTPHPNRAYVTTAQKIVAAQVRTYMLALDNAFDIFVIDMLFAGDVTDRVIPQFYKLTGSISGTTLTVTAVDAGAAILNGQALWLYSDYTNSYGTIRTQLTGTPGGVGTYQLSGSLTIASVQMGINIYTDAQIHPTNKGGVYYGRQFAQVFKRMASAWVQPFTALSTNMLYDGSTAATAPATGTVPTSLSLTVQNATSYTEVAEQPYWQETINAPVVAWPTWGQSDIGSGYIATFTMPQPSVMVSPFITVKIVSGAAALRDLYFRAYLTDGTSSAFRPFLASSTNDADIDWLDGDILTIIMPPEIPVTGSITAFRTYIGRSAKVAGGTFTVEYQNNGVYLLDSPALQTVVNNSTSGTTTFAMPRVDAADKKVKIYLNAATGTASYTFPTPFTQVPEIVASNGLAAGVVTSLSVTSVTVTGSASTGFIVLEGW